MKKLLLGAGTLVAAVVPVAAVVACGSKSNPATAYGQSFQSLNLMAYTDGSTIKVVNVSSDQFIGNTVLKDDAITTSYNGSKDEAKNIINKANDKADAIEKEIIEKIVLYSSEHTKPHVIEHKVRAWLGKIKELRTTWEIEAIDSLIRPLVTPAKDKALEGHSILEAKVLYGETDVFIINPLFTEPQDQKFLKEIFNNELPILLKFAKLSNGLTTYIEGL